MKSRHKNHMYRRPEMRKNKKIHRMYVECLIPVKYATNVLVELGDGDAAEDLRGDDGETKILHNFPKITEMDIQCSIDDNTAMDDLEAATPYNPRVGKLYFFEDSEKFGNDVQVSFRDLVKMCE